MSNCYKCTENLCDLILDCNGDGTLTVPYVATADYTYKLVMKFKNRRIVFTKELNVGDLIIFDVVELNENYCYQFHIEDANGIMEFSGINNFRICTNQEYSNSLS